MTENSEDLARQGQRLGERYEIGAVIGRGGMAEVHEGTDHRLGRRVAIKILRPELARDPAFQTRFRREAQSAASLNHPNIVAVYDTGEELVESGQPGAPKQYVPFIVMEHVDGMTLRQLLTSGRRLLPERALEITDGILAGLDYSHRHGIVHRDIKPANVMLTTAGEVKVMDFGIARALADGGQTVTNASVVMGTAQYLSPEQARGELVDSRSDLYSAGCLLYELLTGRPPFLGDSPVSVAYQHVSEQPALPSSLDPAVPPSVDAVVLQSLAKNPADRYQTAAEMRADVQRALAGLPVTAALAPVAAYASDATRAIPFVADPAPSRRSPWVWVGIVAGVIAVAAATILLARMLFGSTETESVAVPDLAGKTVAQAQANLTALGLVLGVQTPAPSADRPAGTIVSQNPSPGASIAKGQAIEVSVSTGKAKVDVPDLTNLTRADAQRVLSDNKLVLGVVSEVSSDQAGDTVVSQTPAAGTQAEVGSKVSVKVSSGKVKVPDVVGNTEAQARATLVAAGFVVQVESAQDGTKPAGTVLAQAPQRDTAAAKNSTVVITIATAPPPPTTAPPTTPPPTTLPPTTPPPTASPTP